MLPELQRLSNEEVGRDMMMNRDVMGREVMGRAAVCAPTPHEAGGVSLTAAAVDFAHEADGMTLHLSAKSATGYASSRVRRPQPPNNPTPPTPTPTLTP